MLVEIKVQVLVVLGVAVGMLMLYIRNKFS